MTATPSLLEETVEGGAGVFGGVQGLRSGEVEGLRGRVEAAGVAHVLVGDARGDGLRALETSGRVEVRALTAGVKAGGPARSHDPSPCSLGVCTCDRRPWS